MSTLEKAIQIAASAHSGQKDKGGEPYILHPIRVMLRVSSLNERIVAILHDVVEDSSISLDDLITENFSVDVVEAVKALTKQPGETRIEAAARAAKNPITLAVKLADNSENMDISRIPNPTAKDYERLSEYQLVREILISAKTNLPK